MLRTSEVASYSAQFPHQGSALTLSRMIRAIRIEMDETGREQLGEFANVGPGCEVKICSPGYNERTVRVLVNGESLFMFEADLGSALTNMDQ
jgi:hypothetical protein